MDDLNQIVANNLIELRKDKKLTQQELAEEIGYSDKSISKWELGKAIPSVEILMKFASFYGVTVDYLLTDNPKAQKNLKPKDKRNQTNQIIIIAMATTFVFLVAIAVYVVSLLNGSSNTMWISFVWAIPLIAFIDFILTWIFFGKNIWMRILESIFVWSFLISVCLTYLVFVGTNIFFITLVCIPLQVVIILLSQFK